MTKTVKFKNQVYSTEIAADIYFPIDFDEDENYPAIIISHPIGSSKEHDSGNVYGKAFADAGYLAIAFNASFQGQSTENLRYLENPAARVEDIRCTVDYLKTLPVVDAERIGCLGICCSGGYAVKASMTDRRIKAVGTVDGINFGRMIREGFGSDVSPVAALTSIGKQRTANVKGLKLKIDQLLPPSLEQVQRMGIMKATKYYRTSRDENVNDEPCMIMSRMAAMYGFDAFFPAEDLLTQPLLIIIGGIPGSFGSFRDGFDLLNRAKSARKNIVVIPGADHDLYWENQHTKQAIDRLIAFYDENLLFL